MSTKPTKPDPSTLALAVARADLAHQAAFERYQAAANSLAQLQQWQQYQEATRILKALEPQIPTLPGYTEYEAASKALGATEEAREQALEAFKGCESAT